MAARAPRWAYAAAFAFLLFYAFPYQARLNNPNENVRLYMTAAIVEHGTYRIDALRERWGWVNDAATREGHVYSVKAPGTSWLGVPGYAAYLAFTRVLDQPFDRTVALWVCRVTATILPTWLWLLWLWGWLDRQTREPSLRDTTLISIGFGSLLYGYALLFVSHTLSAAAAFVAFAELYDVSRAQVAMTRRRAFWIGTLIAWVTVLEYPGLAASLALAVYAAWVIGMRRPLIGLVLGGAWPALLMMHFQWSAFGSPFTPGHLMVENDAFRSAHEQGVYGAVGPNWSSIHGLLFDLGAGLFPLTPLLALAAPGFVRLIRNKGAERAAAWAALAVCLLTLLAISSMNNWRGGWTIGPRYLAVVVPFMGWAALGWLDAWAERARWAAIAVGLGCAMAGLFGSGLPSLYYPHLPPELTRPVPQLVSLLIAHDYAPFNAGSWLGIHGSRSMLPLGLVAVGLLGAGLLGLAGGRVRALVLGSAVLLGLGLISPLTWRPEVEPGVAKALAFITRRWTPPGHDRVSRLEADLAQSEGSAAGTRADVQAYRLLVETLREEGRDAEASAAKRRFERLTALPRR